MAQQVPYRNSLLIAFLLLIACTEKKHTLVDASRANIVTRKGVTYVNDVMFSGVLFELFPHSYDTASVKSFKQGKPHGLWKSFYANHQLREVRYFSNGHKEGVFQAWWENGQQRVSYFFENDEYEGNGKEWLANGLLIKDMNYSAGHESGLQRMWGNDGILWANYEVRNGRTYGKTGVKACASLWKDEKPVAH